MLKSVKYLAPRSPLYASHQKSDVTKTKKKIDVRFWSEPPAPLPAYVLHACPRTQCICFPAPMLALKGFPRCFTAVILQEHYKKLFLSRNMFLLHKCGVVSQCWASIRKLF